MEFEDWQPFYRQIIEDFGFSIEGDEAVASELDRLLDGTRIGPRELRTRIRGKEVTVAGNASSLASEIKTAEGLLITADEATSVALQHRLSPSILVTDLDGDVSDQLRANEQGTIAVIHGHGDNGPAVREWAPQFRGPTLATTQSRPVGRLENFGGFTDGDRAVYLADHFGAKTIRLVGFDFEHPNPKDSDLRMKQRKLDWAYILLQNLDREEFEL